MNSKIDFIITWVDGNDPIWLAEKQKYTPTEEAGNAINRFRDWDTLKYWFRGVEKFAPWVNSIHLVTCGHYPEWLNKDHPKIKLVKHSDYLPERVLPTFNINPIELSLHKLSDLSEQFVFFNDDMFIIDSISEAAFFKKGKPCDQLLMGVIAPYDMFSYIKINNISIINHHFEKKEVIRKHWPLFFHPSNGFAQNLKNLFLCIWKRFSGMNDPHLPLAYNKKTFDDVWKAESLLLEEVSSHRFRSKQDVNHWLFRYWRNLSGEFTPSKLNGKTFEYSEKNEDNQRIFEYIKKQKTKILCLNDSSPDIDFEKAKEQTIQAFECILPSKSSFEL